MKWYPTISLKFGLMHLWLGNQVSDGRRIFMLAEEIPKFEIGFKFHWLNEVSPMFGLYLYPQPVAYFLWTHSHNLIDRSDDYRS
ncbi:MAG: hypothetical protein ACREQ5_19640 [Candidatus Dormibacteria bacterium]